MAETSRSLQKGRILLVDAMESAAHQRVLALEDAGHEVKRVRLTSDTVRVVRDYPPHCIVLRVHLADDAEVHSFLGEVRRFDHQVEIVVVDEALEPVDTSKIAERFRVMRPGAVEEKKSLEDLVEKALETMSDNFADSRTQPTTMANYGVKLIASISSALIGVDGRGNVSLWNNTAETTFGLESTEALGRPLSRLEIRWVDPATLDKIRAAGLVDMPTRLDDVRFYREDAQERILGMTVNPIHGGTPEDKGMLIMARDISHMRTIESRLCQAQKLEATWRRAQSMAQQIDAPVRQLSEDIHRISHLLAGAGPDGAAEASQNEAAPLQAIAELVGRSVGEIDKVCAAVGALLDFEEEGSGG